MDKERTQSLVSEYYSTMSEANTQIAEAMATNDQERVARLKEYYFGNNGLLSGIQKELGFATDGLNAIQNVYSGFTNSILGQNIGGLGRDISNLLYGSNGSEGAIGAMSGLSSSIEQLFGKGGALATLPETMAAGVKEAIDTTELSDAASSIITNLPDLLTKANALKDLLGNENTGFIAQFNRWIEGQSTEDGESLTQTISNNVKDIVDTLHNGLTLSDTDGDGQWELNIIAGETKQ